MIDPGLAPPPRFLDILRGSPLEACFLFWRDRREPDFVPRKTSIDPVDMPRHILPHLFIYQQIEDGRFRCRLSGTEVCRTFGHNPTGRYLDDIVQPSAVPSRQRLFSKTLERHLPVIYSGRLVQSEHSWMRFHRLLLPISATGERADHIFGMVIFSDFEQFDAHDSQPDLSSPDLEIWATPAELEPMDAAVALSD
jgi:hypothetical protein